MILVNENPATKDSLKLLREQWRKIARLNNEIKQKVLDSKTKKRPWFMFFVSFCEIINIMQCYYMILFVHNSSWFFMIPTYYVMLLIFCKYHLFDVSRYVTSGYRRFVVPTPRGNDASEYRRFVVPTPRGNDASGYRRFVVPTPRGNDASGYRRFVVPKHTELWEQTIQGKREKLCIS